MTDRKRDPLPKDYQFGDARANTIVLIDERGYRYQARLNDTPRDMSLNTVTGDWNVIEDDHFGIGDVITFHDNGKTELTHFTADRDLGDEA